MKTTLFNFFLFLVLMPAFSFAVSDHAHRSKYSGQEKRVIKSLSEADIEELKRGGGWGLAKAAELNGMPGPKHLLEMKDEIGLDADQVKKVEHLFQQMKGQAVPLGNRMIELEDTLNKHFVNRTITDKILKDLLERIAEVRQELRYVHLSAHLKTPAILTPDQIRLYNRLRGYFSDDPCKNIPKGHDSEMWKKHHNCP